MAWAVSASGEEGPSACAGYRSQAAAQERFVALGGGPGKAVGGLDDDGDGVACERLPGPYEGFATIGYNRSKRFFYGVASMPLNESGDGFACLEGNRHFPDGPRLLRVYRAVRGPDRPVTPDVGAEARAATGRLVWKFDKETIPTGRYYAAFEEQIRLSPYKPSACPGFESRSAVLPRRPGG